MRPVSVRFQCFGPYMAEQFVDFETLEKSGLFLLKGAVKDVAAGLHCSQASVYRYLSQVRQENGESL